MFELYKFPQIAMKTGFVTAMFLTFLNFLILDRQGSKNRKNNHIEISIFPSRFMLQLQVILERSLGAIDFSTIFEMALNRIYFYLVRTSNFAESSSSFLFIGQFKFLATSLTFALNFEFANSILKLLHLLLECHYHVVIFPHHRKFRFWFKGINFGL